LEAKVLVLGATLVAASLAGCITSSQPLAANVLSPGLDLPAVPALFADYHVSAEMDEQLLALEAAYPNLLDVTEIGRSVQERPILLAKLTNEALRAPGRPIAFIDGCHHGNENQGCEAPLFVAKFLADNYATNSTVRWMLDNFEVHLVPNVNPDGHDLQTRVNANGINLNRNYPTDHGNPLGLSYPLGEPVTPLTWRLPSPWVPQPVAGAIPSNVPFQRPVRPSENGGFQPNDQPETRAIAVHMQRISQDMAFYITFHTSTHSIVVPWAAMNPPRDIPAEHQAIFDATIDWVNGHMTYQGGTLGWGDSSGNLSYAASGSSVDWAYHGHEVPSWTVETFIPPSVREDWPQDVNFWGNSSLIFVLKALMNVDKLAAWELPDREFPYPADWVGVHYFPDGAPGRQGPQERKAFAEL
jgi:carboxypeptidase T